MRRFPLFAFLAALLLAPTAQSQIVSIYGTFSPAHLSNVRNGNAGTVGNYYYTTANYWSPGGGGGVTLNFLPIGPVRIGLDVRGATKRGGNGYDLGLVGFRVGLKAPLVRIKPYLQASGGYLATRAVLINSPFPTGTTTTDKFGVYEIIGGIDYPLLPFLDFRVIEVGGGQAYNYAGAGDTAGTYNINILTINTGVVFHF